MGAILTNECALLSQLICLRIIPIGAILACECALLSPLTSLRIIPIGAILTRECALLSLLTCYKIKYPLRAVLTLKGDILTRGVQQL